MQIDIIKLAPLNNPVLFLFEVINRIIYGFFTVVGIAFFGLLWYIIFTVIGIYVRAPALWVWGHDAVTNNGYFVYIVKQISTIFCVGNI